MLLPLWLDLESAAPAPTTPLDLGATTVQPLNRREMASLMGERTLMNVTAARTLESLSDGDD